MNYKQARKQLQHALDNQQTIRISKLKTLMQSLNISIKSNNVLVQRKKHGKPTVIHFQGRRFVHKERK